LNPSERMIVRVSLTAHTSFGPLPQTEKKVDLSAIGTAFHVAPS